MELTGPRPRHPEITWTPLNEVAASPDGSAYAEFWLSAPGSADAQLALAGVVAHIGPVLEDLLRSSPQHSGGQTGDDPPATAS